MSKAFTLIELLVVVLIIGILSAIALPQYQNAVEKARFAEALSLSGTLRNAADIWLLENGSSLVIGTNVYLLGDNAVGNLSVDLPAGFDCSFGGGTECIGKNFSYHVGCNAGGCWLTVARYVNGNVAYSVSWNKFPISASWAGDECDYYPDVSSAGEKICKGLAAQGNGFFACEDC